MLEVLPKVCSSYIIPTPGILGHCFPQTVVRLWQQGRNSNDEKSDKESSSGERQYMDSRQEWRSEPCERKALYQILSFLNVSAVN